MSMFTSGGLLSEGMLREAADKLAEGGTKYAQPTIYAVPASLEVRMSDGTKFVMGEVRNVEIQTDYEGCRTTLTAVGDNMNVTKAKATGGYLFGGSIRGIGESTMNDGIRITTGDCCTQDVAVGSKVRIRKGYHGAGKTGRFTGMSPFEAGMAMVAWRKGPIGPVLVSSLELVILTPEQRRAKDFKKRTGRKPNKAERATMEAAQR
jgi:hypothetical protein